MLPISNIVRLECPHDFKQRRFPRTAPPQAPYLATGSLKGRTILMSGGSRGIGLAIALRAARDGANIVLMAKTGEPHAKLEGTVFSAAEQLEAAGGQALAARRRRAQ